MHNLKNLVHAAHNQNIEQFSKELSNMRLAVSSIGEGSYSRSSHEKAWMYICGCLSSQQDDLRAVATTLWIKLVRENKLSHKDDWKGLRSDLACVLLASNKDTILDVIEDFKHEIQPTTEFPQAPRNVVLDALIEWISEQEWDNSDQLLNTLISDNGIDHDSLVYKSVRRSNVELLECLMRAVDTPLRERFALYVAGTWAQKIVEQKSPQQINRDFNEIQTMFSAIKNDFNLDNLIECGLVDRRQRNDIVDIGAMYWPIYHSFSWDGVSEPPKIPETQCRQFNVLLQHIDLPSTTKHLDTLKKMHALCPEELPCLQEWLNHMEKVRLLSYITIPAHPNKKKM